jgi:hypothetical protein
LNARELRLLFVVASAVVFVDTMFYPAVARYNTDRRDP